MREYVELAPAKVNLTLHVGPLQANGRHPLRSLVAFAPQAHDVLRFEAGDEDGAFRFDVTGPMAGALEGDGDNLVLLAWRALTAFSGRSVSGRLVLDKHLPVAAGIGGGSADAGAALRLFQKVNGALDPAAVAEIAACLGGDVPAAYLSRPCWMEGEGETITPLDNLPEVSALLVNPRVACPTGPVFQAFDRATGNKGADLGETPESFADAGALIDWLSVQRNDLEAVAKAIIPVVGEVMDALAGYDGVRLVRMSGSGATCFAVFESKEATGKAGMALAKAHPNWWVYGTFLGDGI